MERALTQSSHEMHTGSLARSLVVVLSLLQAGPMAAGAEEDAGRGPGPGGGVASEQQHEPEGLRRRGGGAEGAAAPQAQAQGPQQPEEPVVFSRPVIALFALWLVLLFLRDMGACCRPVRPCVQATLSCASP